MAGLGSTRSVRWDGQPWLMLLLAVGRLYTCRQCGRGGIGRRTRFRSERFTAWGFESLRPHQAPMRPEPNGALQAARETFGAPTGPAVNAIPNASINAIIVLRVGLPFSLHERSGCSRDRPVFLASPTLPSIVPAVSPGCESARSRATLTVPKPRQGPFLP